MIEYEFINDAKVSLSIQKYLKEELRYALLSKIEVFKTPIVTRIVVKAAKPAIVIGRKGQNIRHITEEISRRFRVDNPQIEVIPIEEPNLDAQVQAERIAIALEKGVSWRPLLNRTLSKIMSAGAKGAEIIISGKIGARGARSRTERVYTGYMKKCGEPSKLVDSGFAEAKTKWGIIGVTVRIVHPNVVFPDHIEIPKVEVKSIEQNEGAQS